MAITIETLQPNADFACAGWLTSVFGFCDGTLWSYIDEGIGSTDALYTQCFNPPIPLAVRYDLTAPTPGLGILQSIRVGIHAAVNSGSDNFTLRVFDGNTQLGGDQIVNVTANFPTGADYYTLPIDVSSLGLTEAHLSDMRVEVETATNPAIIFYVWTLDVELTWDDSPVVLDINLASTDVYGLNRIAQAVTPSADWEFAGWSGDLTGTTNPELLTMDSNKTVTATFTEIPEEIIVDDVDAVFVGTWPTSTYVSGYYGDGYRYHFIGDGSNTATWEFIIPEAGFWEVFAMWSSYPNRATNAPYTINHADGSTTVTMNQETQGGTWVSLGVYNFNAGTASVVLSDDANQFVIADAIRLVPS